MTFRRRIKALWASVARCVCFAAALSIVTSLSSCGGDDSSSSYALNVYVTGLTGSGLQVTLNGGGYFAYHSVPSNLRSLGAFLHYVKVLWQRTLRRRSQKDRTTWERAAKLAAAFLPRPHILHPWPEQRFLVKHPRWKPTA